MAVTKRTIHSALGTLWPYGVHQMVSNLTIKVLVTGRIIFKEALKDRLPDKYPNKVKVYVFVLFER